MISIRRDGQIVVVYPDVDRLDQMSGRDLVHQLRDHVASGAQILLNLQPITYINSEALGYITMCTRRAKHHRGALAVCCLQKGPAGVFKMMRLERVLDGVFKTEQEGVDALEKKSTGGGRRPTPIR